MRKDFLELISLWIKEHRIYFNEINTMPGLRQLVCIRKLMDYDGINAKQLIGKLINLTWIRYEKNRVMEEGSYTCKMLLTKIKKQALLSIRKNKSLNL